MGSCSSNGSPFVFANATLLRLRVMSHRSDHVRGVEPKGPPGFDERDALQVNPVVKRSLRDADALRKLIDVDEYSGRRRWKIFRPKLFHLPVLASMSCPAGQL